VEGITGSNMVILMNSHSDACLSKFVSSSMWHCVVW
jgi:hypothetical protein